MTEKLLTIIVPAFNAGKTLRTALDSFLAPSERGRLDIIVVDDGSTDDTGLIARDYAGRFPGIVRLLSKENGGHGSAINAASRTALGKYLKVIDADDWTEKEHLSSFIERLEGAEADVVMTHYRTVHLRSGKTTPFTISGAPLGETISVRGFLALGPKAWRCCTFHGLCYRTDFYLRCGFNLSEHVFYEDQEYATLPFLQARTILPLDQYLYEYLIGNAAQSTSDDVMTRRLPDLERVFWRIHSMAPQDADTPARAYFDYKLAEILLGYYTAALIRSPDRRAGRDQARRMRRLVNDADRRLAGKTAVRYRLAYAMHLAGLTGERLDRLRAFPCYQSMRRLIR